MSKRKYDSVQSAKLEQLRQVHKGKVLHAASVEAEIRAAIANQTRDWELRESRLMNEAKALGVTKTDISLAVGQTNWYVLQDKYALTEAEFEIVELPQWDIDLDHSEVTLRWFQFSDGTRIYGEEIIPILPNGYTAWPMLGADGPIGEAAKEYLAKGSPGLMKEVVDFVEEKFREARND